MAKPPRRKRTNLDYECDAFGCRPKKTLKNRSTFQGSGKSRGDGGGPIPPRYDWEVEKTPIMKSTDVPETDVNLDIGLVEGGKETQLFKGSYQEAQNKEKFREAAKLKTFAGTGLPKFAVQNVVGVRQKW